MTGGGGALRPHRRTLIAAAGVLLAGIAAAFMPPPAALAEAASRWIVALISAAVVAFAILPSLVWRSVARPGVWTGLAIVSLTLGIAAFLTSNYVERTCTTNYAGKPIVIGTELNPLGANYKRANPGLSTEDLLFDAAGAPERIWTPSSIGRCRALVGGTYFLAIPFLAICLLAAAEAIPTTILSPVRWGTSAAATGPEAVPVRYDVFVSYRHEAADRAFATELVATLEADGYRVAIDERDFQANQSFLLEMERCIRESRFTVAVISPRYLASGATQEEAIISRVLDLGDRKRRLIPLVIEPVSMPAWLYGIVGIDFTRRDPLVDPYDKLRATLGAPSSP
jgi:TIR domain